MGVRISQEVSREALAAAFTEWERRYREEPERFVSETERLQSGEAPETYGEACAPYLISILNEQAITGSPDR